MLFCISDLSRFVPANSPAGPPAPLYLSNNDVLSFVLLGDNFRCVLVIFYLIIIVFLISVDVFTMISLVSPHGPPGA